MEQLTTLQACAKNKFINDYLKLPSSIGKPITNSNLGFLVEVTFSHHAFPNCRIITTVVLTWDEVDRWVLQQRIRC